MPGVDVAAVEVAVAEDAGEVGVVDAVEVLDVVIGVELAVV